MSDDTKRVRRSYLEWPYFITMNFPWDGSSWDVYCSGLNPYRQTRVVCVRGRMLGREYVLPNLDAFMDGRMRDFDALASSGGSGGRSPSRNRRTPGTDPK